MSDEEIERLSLDPAPLPPIAAEAVKFFSGEGDDVESIIKRETLTDLVALSFSLKNTEDEIKEKREKLNAEIKRQLDADKMARGKAIKDFDERKVILTKKAGRASILWEKYVSDQMKPETVKELQEILAQVKKGEVSSPYVEVGNDSVSIEII